MDKMIFVNLPVSDLEASKAFYASLGFTNNPQFTDEKAAAMMWSEHITVMLLSREFWRTFTDRPIPDKGSSEVALCVNLPSRADVDQMVHTAEANGGTVDSNPPQDHGFMYQRTIIDPDGHVWEPMWMDPAVARGEKPVEHQPA